MTLTVDRMAQILVEEMTGQEHPEDTPNARTFRDSLQADLALAKERGWEVAIPSEWEVDTEELDDVSLDDLDLKSAPDSGPDFFHQTKTTATEWLAAEGLAPPPGVTTELPAWMIEEIDQQLRTVFEQEFWEKISQTTQADIGQFLEKGLKEGWSTQKIADEIRAAGGLGFEYYKRRSENIAATESGNVLNAARKGAMDQLQTELAGVATVMPEWRSVLGNTTRDDHADLDGVFADANGLWDLGGVKIPWPGHHSLPPEQRCRCKCTIINQLGPPPGF